ncbi:histidinol-phosphate transaminase [Parvularcula sp. IMCC14364]|uniref:histidinol-phosphate transaminase n=1 Tax=Parvularcula sp. IMCC14364 TaxID=3067902 RepID=UPI0027404DAF|nr:histidinol-phosphate transaminase [Parvularcula sp. IMCC14364]
MTSLAQRLARPEILALEPYQTAYDENDRAQAIKLDANENPYTPLLTDSLAASVNRYPEPQPDRLLARLASLYQVDKRNIIVGRGADEAIELLIRAFCRPSEDAVLVCPPTFSYYETVAQIQGARVLQTPLNNDFSIQKDEIIAAGVSEENLKLIFLCSPMNPTGNSIPPEDILDICSKLTDSLIVLDEAYIEFSEQDSLSSHLPQTDNLVILRTLSKAYGLAGARCGCALAHPDVIDVLRRIMPPYPLSSLTEEAVMQAISPFMMPLANERVREILAQRERLMTSLPLAEDICDVYPSDANAIFVRVTDSDSFQQKMDRAGIKVRRRENVFKGGFRITVGTPAENDTLLSVLGVFKSAEKSRAAEKIRKTKETQIACRIDLDESGRIEIETGIGFFDHMLEQVARHGGFSLSLVCKGDLEIDAHHTLEDCMLTFGECLKSALGDKRGIGRFGFLLPMDETEAQVSLDLGGRPYSVFTGAFSATHIGAYPTEMTAHLFRSFADSLGASVHVSVRGENDHHKTEACFKALGRALRMAVRREGSDIPSTKGVL